MASTNSPQQTSLKLTVLCFSKDRAFQLGELLSSLSWSYGPTAPPYSMAVVYAASSPLHQTAYQTLAGRWPDVQFLREGQSDEKTFQSLFLGQVGALASTFVQLCVDDMLFYDRIPLHRVLQALEKVWREQRCSAGSALVLFLISHPTPTQDTSLLGFYPVLHKHVSWCHPADKAAQQPPLMAVPGGAAAAEPAPASGEAKVSQAEAGEGGSRLVKFVRMLGSKDWNYPFTLCGGLYRTADLRTILQEAQRADPKAASHPNTLELRGNQALAASQLQFARGYCLCPEQPACSVITVNRVQEVFKNRVYSTQQLDASPDALVELMERSLCFDLDRYRAEAGSGAFASVHIGAFYTKQRSAAEEYVTSTKHVSPAGDDS